MCLHAVVNVCLNYLVFVIVSRSLISNNLKILEEKVNMSSEERVLSFFVVPYVSTNTVVLNWAGLGIHYHIPLPVNQHQL